MRRCTLHEKIWANLNKELLIKFTEMKDYVTTLNLHPSPSLVLK